MRNSSPSQDRLVAIIVDDDPDLTQSLGEVLEDVGFTAVPAMSIELARSAIQAHTVAILIVDLDLGDESSRRLLDDLADREHAPPTLMLSGSDEARAVAAEFGVAWLDKPFDLDELLTTIATTRKYGVRPFRRAASGFESRLSWSDLVRLGKTGG